MSDVQISVTSKDKIAFLVEQYRDQKISPSQSCSFQNDTVHYLSPASTDARSLHEGDFLEYEHFPLFPRVVPGDYASTSSSSMSCREPNYQRTLAILKSEAMMYKDVVLRAVFESGLNILSRRFIHLTPEQVAEIYSQFYGSYIFPHMILSVSIGPVLVLSLGGVNAVERWKQMIGPYKILREEWFFPYSVRTRFGLVEDMPDVLHASENISDANKENRYFFPKNILEPLLCDEDRVRDYLTLKINPTLLKGLTELVRKKPVEPILFLAEWLLLHNPFQPEFPKEIALAVT